MVFVNLTWLLIHSFTNFTEEGRSRVFYMLSPRFRNRTRPVNM